MIKVVTFDFWETLVHDTAENLSVQRGLRIGGLRRALAAAGVPLGEAEAERAYDRAVAVVAERFWSRQRDLSSREQVSLILECLAPGVTGRMAPAVLEQAISDFISPVLTHPPSLQPGAPEAVRRLAASGLTLGIISNTGHTPGVVLRRLLAAHDLLRYFSVVSYSDEVGYRKPEPTIFRRTLDGTGASAAEAAHVGDNPVDDVSGARGVGMRAVHYATEGRVPASHADLVVSHLGDLPARLTSL